MNDSREMSQAERDALAVIGAKIGRFEFTVGELRAAFERVAPTPNWKAPIATTVTITNERDNQLIRAAVTFMTGSVATLYTTADPNTYRIEAAGYYAAIGA